MKTTHKQVLALMGLGAVGVASVAWAQNRVKLVINGNPVYTQTRVIGGQTYIPLNDVAAALKMKVYPQGSQIVLRPSGGTYQLNTKFSGKIGEELFTGQYRFTVLNVEETEVYEKRWPNRFNSARPVKAAAGEKLVVITARLKNGTRVKDKWAFTTGQWAGNTALTDMNERAHAPYAYDVAADESAPLGAIALPGAAVSFAVIFRVPEDAQVKDLVYTIVRYQTRAKKVGTDVRVSLQR